MQFITNGPDIPDALLQAHEEGRVVFFCGAGISYPAGLPGFKELVKEIYRLNGTVFSDIECEAFKQGQFDATLDLLEQRLPGQRLAVRCALAQALKPKLRRKGAIDTQVALLRLARSREGALRLVTTNFDRIFHVAAKRMGQKFHAYAAPMLPIPKSSRWDGLVYLVPRPKLNLIRFYGVLAPNAKLRPKIIPGEKKGKSSPSDANDDAPHSAASVRISWARLLKRVFDIDIEHCPHCGGTLKIIAAILESGAITKILDHLGLPAKAFELFDPI